jgi:hypothetical protein
MKRVGLSLFLLFTFFFSNAQSPVNLGIKVGSNSSSLITDFNEFFTESEINHYLAGAFARVSLGRLYLQPEVYFNTKGGVLTAANSVNEMSDFSEVFSYQTIDIPILIGVYIINKPIFNLRVNAGPVLQYVTADPILSDASHLNIDELKDNYIGIQAGIGFDLWFLSFDARIENSFNIFIDNSNFSAANRVYLISAGIKLF